ncbi:L,D-transpeptidase [Microbacterium sp. ET2]|uniref:L,D-transpeptidase n=1 Tax=Microbacterium albipurpureum TaxID=3050384 RepID=UPI00259CB765|nr:L,D-transpeptidase [Microbacterium sp. ET2 (Ac-2212)]WJL95360.1 L,D-transpeptidase [Microbacterium sp. ET2 (Ac-2212)]
MRASQESGTAPRRAWIAVTVGIVVLAAGFTGAWLLRPDAAPEPAAVPTPTVVTPSVTPTPEATPPPAPAGFAANTAAYELAALPQVDVFAVLPQLPVDTDPATVLTGEVVTAAGAGAPVFADPAGDPVAVLPAEYVYGGTTVPVVERQEHWVRVLLTGRQATPSTGNPGQLSGWLRAQDVTFSTVDARVEVSLSARTIDIVRPGGSERIATDFGSGVEGTPTPTGRSFIMTTRVEPSFGYTRGYPLVYLSVQSPTLDGFGGADVAITAFHYHDSRSGAISNGCIRLDPAAIEKLAELPMGTPVLILP